jgi:hypothetical protein
MLEDQTAVDMLLSPQLNQCEVFAHGPASAGAF